MSVVPFPLAATRFGRFSRARQEMLREWLAWLATNPSPEDVAAELDGTHAAMRGLQEVQPYLVEDRS